MTNEELARLTLLCERATPCPWTYYSRNSSNENNDLDNNDIFLGWEIEGPPEPGRGQLQKGWDAAFICEVRTLLPKLLKYVHELRETCKEYVTPY